MSDWETIDLGRYVTLESGARPKGGVTFDSGDIPSLGGENVLLSGGIQYEPVKRVSSNYYHQMTKGILQNKDVLINKDGANTGKVGLYLSSHYPKACINEHLFILRANPEKLIQEYFYYLILSNVGQKKIKEKISGSAQPGLGRTFLNGFFTQVPRSLAEQRKIAEVLTTVDDAIEQTEALIRKYQRIKQGLMQDLLLPRKAWPVMPLGIACKKGGGSIQTGPFGSQLHSGDYKDEGVPIITVEHLGDNEIIHSNLPLVGEEDYLRLSKYKLITGDLVFSRVGAIDRCAYVSENENGWLFSGRCLRVRPGKLFDQKFLSYLLNHYSSRQWILNNSVGSTMRCLNTTILSELPIILPSLDEQKDIGDKLTSIDDQIQIIRREYEKLKKIKQGLMQDLLTGKVRVNALLEQ